MYDFLGVTENWAALENMAWTIRWRFIDANGEALNLDGVMFKGQVEVGEEKYELVIEKSEAEDEGNVIIVTCPGLPEGRHYYEVYSVADSGEENRMLSGYVGVVKSTQEMVDELTRYDSRTLSVRIASEGVKKVKLEWLANSVAAQAAAEAMKYLEEVREKWNGLSDLIKKAEEAGKRLEGLDESLDAAEALINAAIEDTIPYVGENGNWWRRIGERAYDLGMRAIGRDGKDGRDGIDGEDGRDGIDGAPGKDGDDGHSPEIRWTETDVDGIHYEGFYWWNWNDDEKAYKFSKTRAEAKDGAPGRDADDFVRLLLDDESQLPKEGRFGTICYVKKPEGEEGYKMYMWLEKRDGTQEWIYVPDDNLAEHYMLRDFTNAQNVASDYEVASTDGQVPLVGWVKKALAAMANSVKEQVSKLASTTIAGLVKISSSQVFSEGGVIGVNNNGQIVVVPAKAAVWGCIKYSSDATIDGAHAAVVGRNASNQAMVPAAGYRKYGALMLGTNYPITPNAPGLIVPITVANGDLKYNQEAGNMKDAIMFNLAADGCLRYDKNAPNGPDSNRNEPAIYVQYDESLTVTNGKLSAKPWVASKFDATNPRPVNSAAMKAYVDDAIKTALKSYASSTDIDTKITEKLKSYVTSTTLTNQLKNYVTSTSLNTKLSSYLTSSALTSKLSGYVTTSSLNTTLGNYVIGEGGIKKIQQITQSSFNSLGTKATNTYYIIVN